MLNERQQEAMRRLEVSKDVVVDVETSGLSWQRNHIVGWVLTFGPKDTDSYYLPFRHAGGGNVEGVRVPEDKEGWDGTVHPVEAEIVSLLDRQDKHLVYHNGSFDIKFMYRVGYRFNPRHSDTMINACLLDEWQQSFSLDFCCKTMGVAQKRTTIYDYILSKFPEARAAPKAAMGHYWRLSGADDEAVQYAEADGVSTYQLWQAQLPVLAAQGLERVHDVECRLIPVLARMTCRGVKIDVERLHEVKKIIEDKLEEARKALPEGFNSRAPSQVRALMEGGGHTGWPLTPKGQPSFPESWLDTNPVGKQIVATRKCANLLSAFIQPMIDTHLWNGRCHPDYNQLRSDEFGTVTGRLSSSNPNLMQINKRNKDLGKLHRSIFVADEGEKWCSTDLRQCEPVLLAYYSRAKILLDGYRADPPVDAHQAVATAANIDREMGKRANQTIITGGGKGVLVKKYGIAPDKVDEVWNAYFKAMPELKPFQRRAADTLVSRGYVMSVLGRRARLKDRNKSYVAVNRLLQGSNADWIKSAMVLIDEYLQTEGKSSVCMVNSVHDSLDFVFAENDRHVLNRCLELFVDPKPFISIDVPMRADKGEGESWAEATWPT